MAFLEAFKADFFRMTGMPMRVDARCLVQFCFRHNVRFMYWFRKYAETGSIFSRYQLYRYSRKYGLEFALNAKIGSGIYIGHPYNITVGDGGFHGVQCKYT